MKKLIKRVFKFRGYWLFLTKDVLVRVKEDIYAYYHIIGYSFFKRPWYIRKIFLWDEMTKQKSKSRVYLEVVSQKDNILILEVRNGLISK